MSELKIKVGLELDDDIKELIHKEIIRQLQDKSTELKTKNKTLCEVLQELKDDMNDIQNKIDALMNK